MTRILIGGFLIAHGLVHIGMWGVPKLQTAEGSPFVSSDSWLIGSTKRLAAVLAVLTVRTGATGFYLPFKMMYLVVFPCAVLAAVALGWTVHAVAGRVPRLGRAVAVVPVVLALSFAAPRVPRVRQKSPINEPAYAAGLWAREHLPPACIDYFSKHWLTGYWMHLDVLGNPRASARMRAESFEFHDSAAKWLQGRGLPYGFVENLADIPRELRPEMVPVHTVGSAALVRNLRSAGCP